jgi:two-component system, OmpR family, phosphate regulon response regulator OmpR
MAYPRILVLDSEENFLNLLRRILGKEGYEVYATMNVQEGVGRHELNPFDLVIADSHLEALDGLAILERVKNRNGNTEVILITALSADRARSAAYLRGATAYLVKPIDIEELKGMIRKMLSPF